MRGQYWLIASIVAAASLVPSVANASFGCTVGPTARGYSELYQAPKDGAAVLRRIADGEMVSIVTAPTKPPAGWAAVTHAKNGSRQHGDGDFGWMRAADLKDCG